MFTLLFRKMRNTKWMVLCLLIGFVMASAMMSTIPIYMNASLQRMLVKDLESFQTEYDIYPGAYNTSYGLKMDISGSEQQKAVENYNNNFVALFKARFYLGLRACRKSCFHFNGSFFTVFQHINYLCAVNLFYQII